MQQDTRRLNIFLRPTVKAKTEKAALQWILPLGALPAHFVKTHANDISRQQRLSDSGPPVKEQQSSVVLCRQQLVPEASGEVGLRQIQLWEVGDLAVVQVGGKGLRCDIRRSSKRFLGKQEEAERTEMVHEMASVYADRELSHAFGAVQILMHPNVGLLSVHAAELQVEELEGGKFGWEKSVFSAEVKFLLD